MNCFSCGDFYNSENLVQRIKQCYQVKKKNRKASYWNARVLRKTFVVLLDWHRIKESTIDQHKLHKKTKRENCATSFRKHLCFISYFTYSVTCLKYVEVGMFTCKILYHSLIGDICLFLFAKLLLHCKVPFLLF